MILETLYVVKSIVFFRLYRAEFAIRYRRRLLAVKEWITHLDCVSREGNVCLLYNKRTYHYEKQSYP